MTEHRKHKKPGRLVHALVAVGLAASLFSIPAAAAEVVLKAVTAFPKTLAFSESFLGLVELINERGQGKVRIDYLGGPEVLPPQSQVDAVRRGVVDMQYGPATYYLGKMPEADAWVGSTVTAMAARENGGFAIMEEVFEKKLGVRLLAHLDSGVQFYLYLLNEPARKADGSLDLDGLKIRSQPIYKSFFESLGLVPVSIPVPDVYTGLERNTIDGAGWPLIAIQDLSWDKFLAYRVEPGFFQTDLAVIVNPGTWADLPADVRQIISSSAAEYERVSYDRMQALIETTREAVAAGGMQTVELTGDAREAYLDAAYDRAWNRLKQSGSEYYDALRAKYYTR